MTFVDSLVGTPIQSKTEFTNRISKSNISLLGNGMVYLSEPTLLRLMRKTIRIIVRALIGQALVEYMDYLSAQQLQSELET